MDKNAVMIPNSSGRVFLGRIGEADRVAELLGHWPLVTITGPGGVGKTALAASIARRRGDQSAATVVWCDLTQIPQGGQIDDFVGACLGSCSLDAAVSRLANRDTVLVVFDNCEHVIPSVANTVQRLVGVATGARILATSREPLALDLEQVFVLGPLVPDVAVMLLRTHASQFGAAVDDVGDEILAPLCRNLDDLPLAIEFAAARLRTMAPAEIAAHLDHRLDLLTGGRSSPQRHSSLRANAAWSYELLNDVEQRWFARLGVFSGLFTLDDAHRVCGEDNEEELDVVEVLDRLVTSSLVMSTPRGGTTCFRLLRTLREFAREQLRASDDMPGLRERLRNHLHQVARHLVAIGLRAWDTSVTDQLLTKIDDLCWSIRQCLAMDDDPSQVFDLYLATWGIVHRGVAPVLAPLGDEILSRWPLGSHSGATDAAVVCAAAHFRLAHRDRSEALVRAALAAADAGRIAPVAGRQQMALIEQHKGDLNAALEWVDEALALCESREFTPLADDLRGHRALLLGHMGRREEALDYARQARVESIVGDSLINYSGVADIAGRILLNEDPVAVQHLFAEGLKRCGCDRHSSECAGLIYQSMAVAMLKTSGDAEAARWLCEAVQHFRALGDQIQLWQTLRWIGVWLARNGHTAVARTTLATACSHPATPAVTPVEAAALADAIARVGGDAALAIAPIATQAEITSRVLPLLKVPQAAAPTTASPAVRGGGVMRRDGDMWTLRFGNNRGCQVRDAKGLHDLYALLAQPGQAIHCLVLMGSDIEQSDLGATLDARARCQIEDRIRALQEDLNAAEAAHDIGRAARNREELDYLVAELGRALGLGGRDRRTAASAERARTAVTWRLRAAIKRIDKLYPDLGHHLRHAVRTGTFCVYAPENPVEWDLGN